MIKEKFNQRKFKTANFLYLPSSAIIIIEVDFKILQQPQKAESRMYVYCDILTSFLIKLFKKTIIFLYYNKFNIVKQNDVIYVTFVTEYSSPIEITVTSPWRVMTRPVKTSGVRDTLVTQFTLPTKSTPG